MEEQDIGSGGQAEAWMTAKKEQARCKDEWREPQEIWGGGRGQLMPRL